MDKKELDEVLRLHTLWLKGDNKGKKANLSEANLSRANLSEADLRFADLSGAILPDFLIVPETGSFEAWKKCANNVILKILIPEDARRINSLVGRKCRASKIKVIAAYRNGEQIVSSEKFENWRESEYFYEIGKEYVCDDFDDDIRVECTRGIHFFMTRKEAEEW